MNETRTNESAREMFLSFTVAIYLPKHYGSDKCSFNVCTKTRQFRLLSVAMTIQVSLPTVGTIDSTNCMFLQYNSDILTNCQR